MIIPTVSLLLLASTANAAALHHPPRDVVEASLPQFSNSTARADAIAIKRQGWLYGPSLLGDASFFPTGALGGSRITSDIVQFRVDSAYITAASDTDLALVQQAIAAVGPSFRFLY